MLVIIHASVLLLSLLPPEAQEGGAAYLVRIFKTTYIYILKPEP